MTASRSVTFHIICIILLVTSAGSALAASESNLAASAEIMSRETSGQHTVLAIEPLLPEGTDAVTASSAIAMSSESSVVALDFRFSRNISAMAVQADSVSEFMLEGSLDGYSWHNIWKVPTVLTGVGIPDMGLRTRSITLEYPLNVRFLRIRPLSSGGAYLARLKLYESPPAQWPPVLDYSIPNSRPWLIKWLDFSKDTVFKTSLSMAFTILIFSLFLRSRMNNAIPLNTRFGTGLILFVALSAIAWPNFLNFHYLSYHHQHDFFHYFFGAKYSNELGYRNIYNCSLIAKSENGQQYEMSMTRVRNLEDNSITTGMNILADGDDCRKHFSDRRWSSFKRDIQWYTDQTVLLKGFWNRVFMDHGYNAPPTWNLIATPLTNMVPLTGWGVKVLASIDLLLLALCGIIIYRTFGLIAFFSASCFFFLNPIAIYRYTGGSILRYDWLFMMVSGLAALKTRRNMTAGFALTYAALLRIFPGFILMGIGIRALTEAFREKRLPVPETYARLLAGVLISIALLIPASTLVSGKANTWSDFAVDITKHSGNMTQNQIGLSYAVNAAVLSLQQPVPDKIVAKEALDRYLSGQSRNRFMVSILINALRLAFVLLLAFALSRTKELWEAGILSFGLVIFLVNISNYYFVALLIYGFLWNTRPRAVLLLSILCSTAWLVAIGSSQYLSTYIAMSVLSIAFIVAVTASVAVEAAAPQKG